MSAACPRPRRGGEILLPIVTCALASLSCHGGDEGPAEPPPSFAPAAPAGPRTEAGPRRPEPATGDESQRRTEAVRRAAEELALRGLRPTDYLMNLVVEGDAYRVAFVRRAGAGLRTEVAVRVRRSDLEILSYEGPPDAGP